MKRVEKEIIEMLCELGKKELELTASGLLMMLDGINLTPREAAWILKRLATEIIKDTYYNQNVYIINLTELVQDEESGCVSESE